MKALFNTMSVWVVTNGLNTNDVKVTLQYKANTSKNQAVVVIFRRNNLHQKSLETFSQDSTKVSKIETCKTLQVLRF